MRLGYKDVFVTGFLFVLSTKVYISSLPSVECGSVQSYAQQSILKVWSIIFCQLTD